MEFASYGFEVYTSEVDEHGIDFIIKTKKGMFLEIQVKSIRYGKTNYVFMTKDKWDVNNPNLFLSLLIFQEKKMPGLYLIPAEAWKEPNALLCDKDYVGLRSKPEYGLNISRKNIVLLEKWQFDDMVVSLMDT